MVRRAGSWLFVLAVPGVLLLSACGDSDETAAPNVPAVTQQQPAAEPTPPQVAIVPAAAAPAPVAAVPPPVTPPAAVAPPPTAPVAPPVEPAAAAAPAAPAPQPAALEGVYVGNAVAIEADVIAIDGVRLLLFGIDTVEPPQTCTIDGQPWECWPAAVRQLQTFLGEGPVTCTAVRPPDVFRRVLALCEQGSGSLNERLVRSGFALAVPDEMPGYVEVEAAARAERIGLWQGRFQLPSEWREDRGIQVRRP